MPLQRRTPLKRSGRVKARNSQRRVREFARAYGSRERLAWVKAQPCCVSGNLGNIDAAHVRTGGVGRKADACWTVPLAHDLHLLLHQHGKATFERAYGVDLDTLARETEERWQRHLIGWPL